MIKFGTKTTAFFKSCPLNKQYISIVTMSYLTFKFWSIIRDAQVNHIYMQHQKGGNFFFKFELRSCKRTFDTLMIFFFI